MSHSDPPDAQEIGPAVPVEVGELLTPSLDLVKAGGRITGACCRSERASDTWSYGREVFRRPSSGRENADMTMLGGRRVYTRGDLMERHGLGRSTLEKLYREQDVNGHPAAVGSVGSQLAWDSEEWDRWYAARQAGSKVPAGLVTRDELTVKYGLSRHALKKLWSERESNGHPDVARQVGKALYWDEEQWAAWYAGRQECPVDDGDPDALVTLAEAGRLLGLAQSSVTVYVKRPPAGWPEPVRQEALGGDRVRRLYRRGDVLAYGETRLTHRKCS